MNFVTFIFCMIAGLGAGIATGFAGLSAAVIISPILIGFLGIPSFDAVGIALASDVFASAASSYTYYRNKNINIKNGLVMMIFAVGFTYVGSKLAFLLHTANERLTEFIPVVVSLCLGIRFILAPRQDTDTRIIYSRRSTKVIASALSGAGIGLICGTVGAGGGMALLIMLTMVLGYELKTAVGTSVFIMTFVAATGALSHFFINDAFRFSTHLPEMLVCIGFTLAGAVFAAMVANRVSHKRLALITGIMLLVIGGFTLTGVIFNWNVQI